MYPCTKKQVTKSYFTRRTSCYITMDWLTLSNTNPQYVSDLQYFFLIHGIGTTENSIRGMFVVTQRLRQIDIFKFLSAGVRDHKPALKASVRKGTSTSTYFLCQKKSNSDAKIKRGGKIQLDHVSTWKIARMMNISMTISRARLKKLQQSIAVTNLMWGVLKLRN